MQTTHKKKDTKNIFTVLQSAKNSLRYFKFPRLRCYLDFLFQKSSLTLTGLELEVVPEKVNLGLK